MADGAYLVKIDNIQEQNFLDSFQTAGNFIIKIFGINDHLSLGKKLPRDSKQVYATSQLRIIKFIDMNIDRGIYY